MGIKFTESEIKDMEKDPRVLRALADWHAVKETEAHSIDAELFKGSIEYHGRRQKELEAEADRLEAEF